MPMPHFGSLRAQLHLLCAFTLLTAGCYEGISGSAPAEDAATPNTNEGSSPESISEDATSNPGISDEEAERQAYQSDMADDAWATPSANLAIGNRPIGGSPPIGGGVGNPGSPIRAELVVGPRTPDSVRLRYLCGRGQNELHRRVEGSTYRRHVGIQSCGAAMSTYVDSNLADGTQYCYRMKTTDSQGTIRWSNTVCTRTMYEPYRFNSLAMNDAESTSMLQNFDWRRTDPVYTPTDAPTLWYMNILVDGPDDLQLLRSMGIHAVDLPLFPAEQQVFNSNLHFARLDGKPAGHWVYAVVPGPIYNDIRRQMIERLANQDELLFQAFVFRRIPTTSARAWSTSTARPSPLSYTYVGEMGLDYNATAPRRCTVRNGLRICTLRQEIIGWIGRKVFNFVADLVETVVEGVRATIGRIARLVKGEVDLTIQFDLRNSDPAFGGADEPMMSAWRGTQIPLNNLRVHVYQGLAGFFGHTDDRGRVSLKVAKGWQGKICLELKNNYVKLLRFFTERKVCVTNFPSLSQTTFVRSRVSNRYVNVLAQMTDAAEYVRAVTGRRLPRIDVLAGPGATPFLAGTYSGDARRSYAPCLGRLPNISINLVTRSLPFIDVAAEVLEFFLSVDVVLADDDTRSRGVGVHEFGHTVMCDMMRLASLADADLAWADLIAHITAQTAENEQTYLAEAFADYITMQVLGGTNYVVPTGSSYASSGSTQYCHAGEDCLETNYTESCLPGERCDAFRAQVRRVVSIMQDAFDNLRGQTTDPTDGTFWTPDGSNILKLNRAVDSVRSDEPFELDGPALLDVFERWSDRGNLLRERHFLGAFKDVLLESGHSLDDICDMFALHADSGRCPSYIRSLTAAPGVGERPPGSSNTRSP